MKVHTAINGGNEKGRKASTPTQPVPSRHTQPHLATQPSLTLSRLTAHHLAPQLTISPHISPSCPTTAHYPAQQLTISPHSSLSHPTAHHLSSQLTISPHCSPSRPIWMFNR
ncbi:hypothetical protein Bca4012_018504 [Brassica carinata]